MTADDDGAANDGAANDGAANDGAANDGAFPAAITAVTLGVSDLARSRAYYSALGWEPFEENDGVVFIRLAGQVLVLFANPGLAHDTGLSELRTGPSTITLARNFASVEAVDAAFTRALAAGATSVKQPEPVFWGGYSGYLSDPDGHLWELAHNPFWPIKADGSFGG